jgi:arylsulfatase A-like enzyme
VTINGAPVGEVVLNPGWSTYRMAIPGAVLMAGGNRVSFRFAYAASPDDHGGADSRTLAAAFDVIGLGKGSTAAAEAVTGELPSVSETGIETPVGTVVVYTVKMPPDPVLEVPAVEISPGLRGEVWVRTSEGPPASRLAVPVDDASEGPYLVLLDAEPGALAQIVLAATAEADAEPETGRITWRAPRLYGRASEGEPMPDVVLIVVDTLRADHVGVYGSDVSTPNMDGLAAAGVRFSNAYSHIPITGPSHGTLFSSMLPFEHGAVNNAQIFSPNGPTMPELVSDWGWQTGGVISLGVLNRNFRFDRGFERFGDSFSRDWMKNAGEVNADVMEWLGAISSRPFFAWIHYSDPHEPYTPPGLVYPEVVVMFDGSEVARLTADGRGDGVPVVVPPGSHEVRFAATEDRPRHTIRFPAMWLEDDRLELVRRDGWTTKTFRFAGPSFDTPLPATLEITNPTRDQVSTELRLICKERLSRREIRERYALEVEYVDRRIGELLDELERRGVLSDALVVFASDHGEAFGEHKHVGHISQLYQEAIRVPLIVSFPGRIPAGVVVDDVVGLIDVLPTMAELLGLPLPASVRGRSLVPLLEGRPMPARPLFAETHKPEAYRDRRAVIAGGFKLIHSLGDDEWLELYDLRSDPRETANVSDDRPDLVDEMRSMLDRRAAESERAGSRDADLTDEEKEQLRALGYVR